MILLMAGTTEGREIATFLKERGHKVLSTVTTKAGGEALEGLGERVEIGSLSRGEIESLSRKHDVRLIVDATHPFSVGARVEAFGAARNLRIPYLRFERPTQVLPEYAGMKAARDFAEAAELLPALGKTILMTIGHRNLEIFVEAARSTGSRLIVRILPLKEALLECGRLGIGARDIVALWGPFTKELNLGLLRQFKASAIIAKESGTLGGIEEKVEAARELGLPMVVIKRPEIAETTKLPRHELIRASVGSYDHLVARIEGVLSACPPAPAGPGEKGPQ